MNEKITAIIVEDEEFPRLSLIEKLKINHPEVSIIDACDNCDTALISILKHQPDVLLLDIELPEKNSMWLVNQLKEISSFRLPYIIFTTAYNEPRYLLNAIRLEVVDYLLKPIAFQELAKAIQKVKQKIKEKDSKSSADTERNFTFKTANSILNVKESDLVYCEADSYCSKLFFTNETTELAFENLGFIENKICNRDIIRVGRKYIINSRYIFKVDIKKNLCYFRLPSSGKLVNINLSEGGLEIVKKFIAEKTT